MPNFEQEAKIQAWIFFGPILLSMVVATFIAFNPLGLLILIITFLGGYLVIRSKVKSKLRTREPIEWGLEKMNKKEKSGYVLGYILILISAAFILFQRWG